LGIGVSLASFYSGEASSCVTGELVRAESSHLVANTSWKTGSLRFLRLPFLTWKRANALHGNAGHLPYFGLRTPNPVHLDVVGMVLGIVEDYP